MPRSMAESFCPVIYDLLCLKGEGIRTKLSYTISRMLKYFELNKGRKIAPWLRTPIALLTDLGVIPSTHMTAHDSL